MKKWQKKEKKDSIDFGGYIQKGSGNQWSQPGDIKTADFLYDSKHTDKKSFTITKEIWDKLYEEALFLFKFPALSLQIQDIELVVLDKADFLKLLEQKKSQQLG